MPFNKRAWEKEWRKKKPWLRYLEYAKRRCSDAKHKCFASYGARGIKVTLTRDQIKALWDRDNAAMLKRPSLDRKDTNGDYSYENCLFIEYEENAKRRYEHAAPAPQLAEWEE